MSGTKTLLLWADESVLTLTRAHVVVSAVQLAAVQQGLVRFLVRMEMVEVGRGLDLEVLFSVGGSFLDAAKRKEMGVRNGVVLRHYTKE